MFRQQQLWQIPNLSLAAVASEVGLNSKDISYVINQGVGVNFNDFVNQFRVDAFKQRVQQPDHEQSSILDMALECGFNSKSTFNRVFKRLNQTTPYEYIKSL